MRTKNIKAIMLHVNEIQTMINNDTGTLRRVIKPQPASKLAYCCMGSSFQQGKFNYPAPMALEEWGDEYRIPSGLPKEELNRLWNPPCHADDVLYVREAWRVQSAHRFEADVCIEYKAGGPMDVIQFHGCRRDSKNRLDFDRFVEK